MGLKAVATLVPGGGTPVGGSGTPGTIPVWSGSGTTLGDSPLTVSGSNVTGAGAIRATGTAATAPAFTGSDTDTGIYFPAANQMRFATAGSFVAAFDSTGNFGIGETSPSTYGKLAITVGTTTLALNADATRADVQSYNKPLAINRLGNNTLMNEGGGNVGIGTTSPASALHVRNNTAGITLDSTLGGGRQYQLNPLRTGLSNSGFEIRDVTAGAAVISIDATQQVGIGTASPTAALDLPASSTARASLRIQSGTAPTSPNNGDIWFDGTNIKMRIGGVTKTFTLV